MPTYLYGLLLGRNAARVPREIAGLEGAPARTVDCGELSAVASTLRGAAPAPTVAAVKTHDAVLQACVDNGATVAAARFHQSFASDDDLCSHIHDHGARIARVLAEFDGCVEMRVLLADSSPVQAESPASVSDVSSSVNGPGHEYLRQLRANFARTERLTLSPALGPAVRAERVSLLPHDRGAVFAHLVHRDHLGAYRRAVAQLPALAEARLIGPFALYSFAEPGAAL